MKKYKLTFLSGAFALLTLFAACDKFEEDAAPARMNQLALNDDNYTTQINQPVELKVLANDSIGGQATLQFGPAQHGIISTDSSGAVFYKPTLNYVGTDNFSYQVCLNGNCASAMVTIQVLQDSVSNCSVKAYDDSRDVKYNNPLNLKMLINDNFCGIDTIATNVTISNGPAHGQASITPSKDIHYTPNNNYSGPDEITYSISNSKGQSTAKIHINVLQPACTIQAWPDSSSVLRHLGTAYDSVTVNVLPNDNICPNGGPVMVSVLNPQTTYGNVMVIGTGLNSRIIYGTNYPGKNVSDTFQYKVCQGNNCSINNVQVRIR